MPERLEVLAFLQETTAKLHKLARERPSAISPEMLGIADELAREAAQLESDLLDAGHLDAGLGVPKAAKQH